MPQRTSISTVNLLAWTPLMAPLHTTTSTVLGSYPISSMIVFDTTAMALTYNPSILQPPGIGHLSTSMPSTESTALNPEDSENTIVSDSYSWSTTTRASSRLSQSRVACQVDSILLTVPPMLFSGRDSLGIGHPLEARDTCHPGLCSV